MKNGLIAIVDNNELDRFIYKKIILLTCPDYQLIDFAHGIELLDYLKKHADNSSKLPDLILLDLRMPFLNGWQYLEKYCELKHQLAKNSRHYVCTSSMDRFDRDFKCADLHGYFMKPIAPNDILEMINDTEQYKRKESENGFSAF